MTLRQGSERLTFTTEVLLTGVDIAEIFLDALSASPISREAARLPSRDSPSSLTLSK